MSEIVHPPLVYPLAKLGQTQYYFIARSIIRDGVLQRQALAVHGAWVDREEAFEVLNWNGSIADPEICFEAETRVSTLDLSHLDTLTVDEFTRYVDERIDAGQPVSRVYVSPTVIREVPEWATTRPVTNTAPVPVIRNRGRIESVEKGESK